MAAGVGFEPATFRTQGTEPTTEPPRPTMCASNEVEVEQETIVMLCPVGDDRAFQRAGPTGRARAWLARRARA